MTCFGFKEAKYQIKITKRTFNDIDFIIKYLISFCNALQKLTEFFF